jgi:uncharacterized membrane protein YqjE
MNEPGQPLIGRGKSLLEQVLRIAQTRLELISVEVQREKLALTRQLWLAAAAAICAWLAGLVLILWIALSASPEARTLLFAVLFGVLLIGAIASFLALRRRARREPLFGRVIQQLQLDRASLSEEP